MTASASAPAMTRWRSIWLYSFAAWSAVWILWSIQSLIYFTSKGEPIAWQRFAASLSNNLLWAIFTPAILWYCWRLPLVGARWKTALPFHLLAWLVVSALYIAPALGARYLISRASGDATLYQPSAATFSMLYVYALLAYIDPLLVAMAVHYARESRVRQLRASQLEARLAEAQLRVLRMQLHPHFLFNTLHTISALMHKDVRSADRMLALLGDLLRDSLDKVGAQVVSLKQELGFLERYLEIERTRFQDRLMVETDVDPEALDAEVPNLILQPLVENAIRHGIERRMDTGRIGITARREHDRLVITIRDDGPGLPSESDLALRGGVGLANTQARLTQLYGTAHQFELANRPEGGLEVVLSIPFKLRPQEEPRVVAEATPERAPKPIGGGAAVVGTR